MNQILTDEEVSVITGVGFEATGAIEQAILNKLSEQKPVAWLQTSVEDNVNTVIARTYKPNKFNAEWWRFDPLYLHPAPSAPEGCVLLGRVDSHGNVQWFDKNPHAFPPCTDFYAQVSAARSE